MAGRSKARLPRQWTPVGMSSVALNKGCGHQAWQKIDWLLAGRILVFILWNGNN